MTVIAFETPSHAEMTTLHGLLRGTYWSPGIPREVVERACTNSICAVARDDAGAFIGFARVVSDRATFAWLCDVIVIEAARRRGVGRALVAALRAHPDLQNLRRWLLGTKDAHGVYVALGFGALSQPDRMMEVRDPAPYGPRVS